MPPMTRWFRRLGLALSLSAFGLLAFHADHADEDHASPTHHCCPCHYYSVSPDTAAPLAAPALPGERQPQTAESPRLAADVREPGAARAPPAS